MTPTRAREVLNKTFLLGKPLKYLILSKKYARIGLSKGGDMSYLMQEIEELEEEQREKMNELFPAQYHELEQLTEEIYRLKIELGRAQNKERSA